MLFWVQGSCTVWTEIDEMLYRLRALDDFVIDIGENGKADCVDARAWRVSMERVE